MIVIDIGCARYGGDYSIERLIEEFKPTWLYGFDPVEPLGRAYTEGSTTVFINANGAAAGWTYDGEIGFREDGLNSWVTEVKGAPQVPCFDLARFIVGLDANDIVLKIDAEGSEYDLLKHLMASGADALLALAWIEWHQPDRGRKLIEEHIACEIREWRW